MFGLHDQCFGHNKCYGQGRIAVPVPKSTVIAKNECAELLFLLKMRLVDLFLSNTTNHLVVKLGKSSHDLSLPNLN